MHEQYELCFRKLGNLNLNRHTNLFVFSTHFTLKFKFKKIEFKYVYVRHVHLFIENFECSIFKISKITSLI